MEYCPICGNDLKCLFRLGEICGCCFNECAFDDDLFWDELERVFGIELIRVFIPEYFDMPAEQRGYAEIVDIDKVREMLRAKWCLKGYPKGYQSIEDDPKNYKYLTREEAKKQLQNINVDLDEFEKLFM